MNHGGIESLLRKAPVPEAQAELLVRLLKDVPVRRQMVSMVHVSSFWNLWRRFWPITACVLLSLTVMAAQMRKAARLRKENEMLRARVQSLEAVQLENAQLQRLKAKAAELDRANAERVEFETLSKEAAELRKRAQEISALKVENERLASRLNLPLAFAEVQNDEGASRRCLNNIKNIMLGSMVYATDNEGLMPRDFLTMTNELATPRILWCPADAVRKPADWNSYTWKEFTDANNSYQILAPGAEPQRPLRARVVEGEMIRQLERDSIAAKKAYEVFRDLELKLRSKNRAELREAIPASYSDEVLQRDLAELGKIDKQIQVLLSVFTDENREVKRIRALRGDINARIEARIDGIMSGLETLVKARKAMAEKLELELIETRVDTAVSKNAFPVYLRCLMHGHVGLTDGRPLKSSPDWSLVQTNGAWFVRVNEK